MKKGFTLLELLIVVIVIAILAVIAIPQYFEAIEKAKISEAKGALGEIRKAELAYQSVYGVWSTASTIQVDLDNDTKMDVTLTVPNSANFTYSLSGDEYLATKKPGAAKSSWKINLKDGAISSF